MGRRRGKSFFTIMKQVARESERERKRAERERIKRFNQEQRDLARAEREYEKQLRQEKIEENQYFAKVTKENAENLRDKFLKISNYVEVENGISILSQIDNSYFSEKAPETVKEIIFPEKPLYKERIIEKIIPMLKENHMKKYNEKLLKWEEKCKKIVAENEENTKEYKKKFKSWENRKNKFYKNQEEDNRNIEELNKKYSQGEKEGVESFFELVMEGIIFPDENLENEFDLEYNEKNKILILDFIFPNIEIIPNLKNMTYIKSRDEFNETYITEKQKEKVYNELLYGLSLKIVELLYLQDENDFIESIVFNGWIENINRATGNEQSFCLLSLQTKKEDFEIINLSQVDYKACFRKLKGIAKPNLNDLVPVAPILNINTEDKRFIDNVEIGNKIEGINIANIDWKDFEYLIRELFQKEFSYEGVEVKTTQASKDGGVDAVMFDPDPIKGGKYIIQAKRYNNIVGISAVRDLYGTVHNEGATKGILVTTSDFGADSYEFVKDKPLTLINGSNLLSLLQKHNYKNVRIDLKEF